MRPRSRFAVWPGGKYRGRRAINPNRSGYRSNAQSLPALSSKDVISLSDIQAARTRIQDTIRPAPAIYSENLSRECGATLFLKLESLNVTGSFKERGALNRILLLTKEEQARGVIAASAGNHAQGVACHASRRGIRAVICMPEFTPIVKVSAREPGAGK